VARSGGKWRFDTLSVDTPGSEAVAAVEKPRGHYKASVDNKGRLKLPSAFQKYLGSLNEKSFFVTTTNETTVYIYPLTEWKKVEDWLDNPENDEQVDLFDHIRFVSGKYGADAVIDGEGRMTLPQGLRESFKMVGSDVYLQCGKGLIEVISEEEYKAMDRTYSDKQKLAKANTALRLMGKGK
jgi:MraZ protein